MNNAHLITPANCRLPISDCQLKEEAFGPSYSSVYDALYADKDYEAECDLIERVIATYGGEQGVVQSCDILDLGCGTGRHASLLAARGHRVLGVDRSPHMVAQARERTSPPPLPRGDKGGLESVAASTLEFTTADIRTFRCERKFDIALLMFAVIGYQIEDEDVVEALRTARAHLRNGGLLLFDCWYGPAVLREPPTSRMKPVENSSGRVIRVSTPRLDLPRRRITVHFALEARGKALWDRLSSRPTPRFQDEGPAGKPVPLGEVNDHYKATADSHNDQLHHWEETHCVRFFFEEDFERFLSAAGFSLIRVGAMPDFDRPVDENSWNVTILAKTS